MRRFGSLYFLVFLGVLAPSLRAHEMPSGNLAALGRIWGIVHYAHPSLGYRDVDFDAAALRAIARVRASSTPETLSAAVDEMLATLRDDATFVARPCYEQQAATVDRSTRVLPDDVVYVSATTPATAQTANLLRSARAAIVDLRPQPGRCSAPALSYDLVPLLIRGTVPRAMHRKVRHHGYRSELSNGFDSTFMTLDLGTGQGTAETLANVVFIVDERSAIPPFATDLAATKMATFVSVGRFPLHTAVDHCQMALPDNSIVTLRTSELVAPEGFSTEPFSMMDLAADAPESEVLAAAEHLARPRTSSRRRATGLKPLRLGDYRWRPDKAYAELATPSAEHRILAGFRIWNVIHFFHGSRELLGDWDMQFEPIVVKLEHAQTRRDYELVLAEIMAMVPDGHASVSASRDTAAPPFRLLPVEGKPVVISGTGSVKPGDELLRIDGREVAARMTELARFTSAATEAAKQYAITRDLANGAAGSTSTFTFRRPDGTQYDATLTRTEAAIPAAAKAWRILDGNIAYADLHALATADVPAMFSEIANTRALILDLRDVPLASYAAIAPYIRTNDSPIASLIRTPQLIGGASNHAEAGEHIDDPPVTKYTGRTIALVDERTQGAGEQAALAFRELAGTKLVGSATAGTSGAVTSFVVPGNIAIRFSGTDVRYADGRQVQQVGLQSDTLVPRTIRGVAEGRDEVLERAIKFLDE